MIKRLFAVICAMAIVLTAGAAWAGPVLRMATTTSTANTGLLDYLTPEFQKDTGIELQYVPTGTGKALKLGAGCDADILMVHAPAAEEAFVKAGHGVDRRLVMYNDFVIIGPLQDPAGLKGQPLVAAMKQLGKGQAPFASRGDDSGTNKKERALWKEAGITPPAKADWYLETGQGMIKTILLAQEKNAYTLADRGTYIRYLAGQKGKPGLVVLVAGDPLLYNQYSVITVNPAKCPDTKTDLAKKFSDWVTSPRGQKLIADYRLLNQALFTPNAKE